MEKLDKKINEVVDCITNSLEYKKCIEIQKQMDSNLEIKELINKTKKLQKQYVKSNYDSKIKDVLNEVINKLQEIPLYVIYLENLEVVNRKIDYVKDELNDYFYKLLNEKC